MMAVAIRQVALRSLDGPAFAIFIFATAVYLDRRLIYGSRICRSSDGLSVVRSVSFSGGRSVALHSLEQEVALSLVGP